MRRRLLLSVSALTAVAGAVTAQQMGGTTASLASVRVHVTVAPTSAAPSSVAPVPVPSRSPVAVVRAVAPLRQLAIPDVVAVGTATVDQATLARIRAVPGVTGVQTFAVGHLQLGGKPVVVVGVDPSVFRPFAPGPTAASDALWASVAQGELLVEPAAQKKADLVLGSHVTLASQDVRIGSVAVLQLPGVDGLVDSSLVAPLGLVPDAGLVLTTDGRALAPVKAAVAVLMTTATVTVVAPVVPARPGSGTLTVPLYKAAAATCKGLPWTLLASIGTIESGNGQDPGVSSAGAQGPMQFLPDTFAEYATDGDKDGKADIDDPADAVFSAARMLCRNGSPADGWATAVFSYNHADWYVQAVLQLAARYEAA